MRNQYTRKQKKVKVVKTIIFELDGIRVVDEVIS